MKINIITLNDGYTLATDVRVLLKMFQRFFKGRVTVELVNFYQYEAKVADINIFIEKINNYLFKYAPINIYIANHHKFLKVWKPYLNNFDYIFVKNTHGKQQFKNAGVPTEKIINIGWTSLDKSFNGIGESNKYYNKDYSNWFVPIGQSEYHNLDAILKVWEEHPEFPRLQLAIDNSIRHKIVKSQISSNITLHSHRLEDKELEELQNGCGVHLCLNESGSFSHNIQEGKSVKAVVIATDNNPNVYQLEDNDTGYLVSTKQKRPLKNTLGSRYLIDEESLVSTVKKVMNIIKEDELELESIGEKAHEDFIKNNARFKDKFESTFRKIFSNSQTKIKNEHQYIKDRKDRFDKLNKDENLPFISIITPTYNHQNMFKLAYKNWVYMNYPRHKIEWVIIDDSDNDGDDNNLLEEMENVDTILEMLPKDYLERGIKYIKLKERQTTGAKRNIGVENASHDIIIFMDDDDYYPVNSFKLRVLELLDNKKDCVACTSVGCFDINKFISLVNTYPFELAMDQRIIAASLCFYKSFWKECGFGDKFIGECRQFIKGRENRVYEISSTGIMVALLHNRNLKPNLKTNKEPNGCHFGWSNELFLFITGLDREITKKEEKELKRTRNC